MLCLCLFCAKDARPTTLYCRLWIVSRWPAPIWPEITRDAKRVVCICVCLCVCNMFDSERAILLGSYHIVNCLFVSAPGHCEHGLGALRACSNGTAGIRKKQVLLQCLENIQQIQCPITTSTHFICYISVCSQPIAPRAMASTIHSYRQL